MSKIQITLCFSLIILLYTIFVGYLLHDINKKNEKYYELNMDYHRIIDDNKRISKNNYILKTTNNILVKKLELKKYIMSVNPNVNESDINETVNAIYEYGIYIGVDPLLLTSIIEVESTFYTDAQSNKGAMGLMQLTSITKTHIELKEYNKFVRLNSPVQRNISRGTLYFGELLNKYSGDIKSSLIAYHIGPYAFEKHGITKAGAIYVDKVFDRYDKVTNM